MNSAFNSTPSCPPPPKIATRFTLLLWPSPASCPRWVPEVYNRCMRHSVVSVVLAGSLASSLTLFAAVEVMDEIVCKVNGEIITRTDLEKDPQATRGAGLRTQGGLTGARLKEEVNKRMPDLSAQPHRLAAAGGQKPRNWTSRSTRKSTSGIADLQLRSKIADPEKFQAYVREQTGMPYEDYQRRSEEPDAARARDRRRDQPQDSVQARGAGGLLQRTPGRVSCARNGSS